MKWFKHDSDANQDAKLRKLRLRYGLRGYGLYWYCLELISHNIDEHNLTFELEHDAELIAHDTGTDSAVVEEIMRYMVTLGLFENAEGRISCLKMLKRIDTSMTSNPRMRELIAQAKDSATTSVMLTRMPTNHDPIMTEPVSGHDPVMQEKNKKNKKKINGDEYTADFLEFWDTWPDGFGSKGSKAQAFTEWRKLNGRPPTDVLIASVLAQTYDKAGRRASGTFAENFKHVCRWLKGREWENETPATAVTKEVYR